MTFSATFTVRTVRDMHWLGTTNGELLAKAASQGFDVMITADRNMYYQQSLRELPVAVLLIPTNRSRLLEQIIPAIEESLRVLRSKQFTVMDLGKNRVDWPKIFNQWNTSFGHDRESCAADVFDRLATTAATRRIAIDSLGNGVTLPHGLGRVRHLSCRPSLHV